MSIGRTTPRHAHPDQTWTAPPPPEPLRSGQPSRTPVAYLILALVTVLTSAGLLTVEVIAAHLAGRGVRRALSLVERQFVLVPGGRF